MEKEVEDICYEAYKYRSTDAEKSEKILRAGLQRFPGNCFVQNTYRIM